MEQAAKGKVQECGGCKKARLGVGKQIVHTFKVAIRI